jgi:hypothetical protein
MLTDANAAKLRKFLFQDDPFQEPPGEKETSHVYLTPPEEELPDIQEIEASLDDPRTAAEETSG